MLLLTCLNSCIMSRMIEDWETQADFLKETQEFGGLLSPQVSFSVWMNKHLEVSKLRNISATSNQYQFKLRTLSSFKLVHGRHSLLLFSDNNMSRRLWHVEFHFAFYQCLDFIFEIFDFFWNWKFYCIYNKCVCYFIICRKARKQISCLSKAHFD